MKSKLFLTLFGLPFFAVGVWMLWSVGTSFADARRMQGWVGVDARLLDAGYEVHAGDDSDTYQAYARYSYSWDGRTYTADRVGLSGGADNIGDYQRVTGRRLESLMMLGQPVTVWVNPAEPSQAIIDRGIRWPLIGFKSIFLLVFGGVGLGLIVFAWRMPRDKDAADPRYASTPWLVNDDWQTATIRSGSKATMWGAWAFALLWNLISAPTPFLAWRELRDENYLVLVALLFPLVGIGLLTWAIRRTLEWRRFGAAPLTLDPFPGAIGGHVGGTIDLNLPYDASARFELTLTNIHSYVSGSGKNRSQQEKAAWQDSVVAHAGPGPRGTHLTFRFDVPDGLAESAAEQSGDSYYLWRLNLGAKLPGTDLDRDYNIPVYATGETSRHLPEQAIRRSQQDKGAVDEERVRGIVNIDYGSVGKRLHYPAGRHIGASIIGVVIGGVFAAAGWFLIVQEGHTIFGSIFGGLGLLVALSTLYMMLNSLTVTQDGASIVSVRRLCGIPVRTRRMLRQHFTRFSKHSSMQSHSGGKHTIYYTIYAHDHGGNKLVVGEGFRGRSEADAAMRIIGRELGLREQPSVGADLEPRPLRGRFARQ